MRALLGFGTEDSVVWGPPIIGDESGFRARAKMAVSGTANDPVLGLPGQGTGVDLADCPLYPPVVLTVLEQVRDLIRRAQVPPYDVVRRRGEIRYVVVTAAPDGSTMVQLVLRSEHALGRIREHLPRLLGPAPLVTSVWANIHPDHTTAITGPTDIHLAGERSLPITTGDATLHAGPRSFVQTNTAVAGELYRQAGRWIAAWAPRTVWDLYCGLGGFALHAALACANVHTHGVHSRGLRARDARAGVPVGHDPQHPLPLITGVETRADAVEGARRSAQDAGLGERLRFLCADATTWAQRTAQADGPPDVLVVNPPRRGLGHDLAAWIETSGVARLVYSSCRPETLARDLEAMPSLQITAARYVDMFPHTEHAEVLVRLERRAPA